MKSMKAVIQLLHSSLDLPFLCSWRSQSVLNCNHNLPPLFYI